MTDYVTKDSGARQEYDSGMRRDTEEGMPRFDLILPKGIPYNEQMLTRFAALMARGAEKYTARNWELAEGQEELNRYESSAHRHLMQWIAGETDEDHAAAVFFNVMAAETVKYKMQNTSKVGKIKLNITGPQPAFIDPGVHLSPAGMEMVYGHQGREHA